MPSLHVLCAAGVPCDVVLKLLCGAEMPAVSLFLQAASPFFHGALEDVRSTSVIPVSHMRMRTKYMVAPTEIVCVLLSLSLSALIFCTLSTGGRQLRHVDLHPERPLPNA
jgi:hypothetical protein